MIAAGSLLEIQIAELGLPVGRLELAHLFPMSFVEFLWGIGNDPLAELVPDHSGSDQFTTGLSDDLFALFLDDA